MEIIKWQKSQVTPIIKHNLRRFEDGNSSGNEDIVPELTPQNYSLINRGNTVKEVNKYRKQIEKECFKYNRKNLVHSVEVVIQCPADCPPEQKEAFFQESFEYICSTLPMGKKCVFVAEVHADEKHFAPDGTLVSKDHLHIMYVPAVPDTKHDNFQYKLCADELTKKATLRQLHPNLQAHLDKKGIKATVFQKKEGDGKTLGLSVKQLKEITAQTGITFEKSMTVDDLARIMSNNVELTRTAQQHNMTVAELQKTITDLQQQLHSKEIELAQSKSADITAEKEKSALAEKLQSKEQETQQLKSVANRIISEKNTQINTLQETVEIKQGENDRLQQQLHSVQEAYKSKEQELLQAQEKVRELERKAQTKEAEQEQTWGSSSGWGASSGWGNTTKSKEEEVNV